LNPLGPKGLGRTVDLQTNSVKKVGIAFNPVEKISPTDESVQILWDWFDMIYKGIQIPDIELGEATKVILVLWGVCRVHEIPRYMLDPPY
jgi:hypothetical protein